MDLESRAELRSLCPAVLRWRDCFAPPPDEQDASLAALPYLDRHYGFVPKAAGDDWVRRVLCFNAAGHVSMGPHSTSNSGHRHCVPRVVRGVTGRLYVEQQDDCVAKLRAFDAVELHIPDDFEEAFGSRESPVLELS